MSPTGTARSHQILLFEDTVDGGERGLEEAFIPGRDRHDSMGQVDILLALGHRNNLVDLPGQHPMQWLFRTGCQIDQALSLANPMLPANDATLFDRQDQTAASHRNALLLGGLNHRKDFQFGLLVNPLLGYRSHEPPFVFFARSPVRPTDRPWPVLCPGARA